MNRLSSYPKVRYHVKCTGTKYNFDFFMVPAKPVSVDEEDNGGSEEESACDPAPREGAQQLEAGEGEAIAHGRHGEGASRGQAGITACMQTGICISICT